MGATAGLTAIQAGSQMSSSISQAGALRAQGLYESTQASTNAKLARMQAEDAGNRGEVAASESAKRAGQLMGSQRANLAAQGVALDSGSAAEAQHDTVEMSELDQMTIRNNAAREAMGYKVQASNYEGQGKMAELAAKSNARSTILTGGMSALSSGMKNYVDAKRARDGTLPGSPTGRTR